MRNFFKKLEKVVAMAEDCVYKNIAVKREPLDTNRQRPITARPSVVKFAGVEFSVYYKGNIIEVVYRPGSEASKNAAVNALRARGLREGERFTVTTRGSGRTQSVLRKWPTLKR
ncbi:PaRep2b protein [Pyrobaculum aerophilum]|uniref:PaRep2b protein n=1 Tax=Pyrobaculum aerophilum TaxID=13773 RepID=UPI0026D09CA1|nr:PaRep2b protein [Pyrobaculum aerophilum]